MRKFKLLPLDFDWQFEQSHPRDSRPNKPPIVFKPQRVEPKSKFIFSGASGSRASTPHTTLTPTPICRVRVVPEKQRIVFNKHSDMGVPTTEIPAPNLDMASTAEIATMMTNKPRSSSRLTRPKSGPSLSSRAGVLLSVDVAPP